MTDAHKRIIATNPTFCQFSGYSLGLALVAKSVENDSQRVFLAGLGCDMLQGYRYRKPLPFGETVTHLKVHRAANELPGATPLQSSAPALDC